MIRSGRITYYWDFEPGVAELRQLADAMASLGCAVSLKANGATIEDLRRMIEAWWATSPNVPEDACRLMGLDADQIIADARKEFERRCDEVRRRWND